MLDKLFDFLLLFFYIFCFALKGGSGVDSSMVVAAYLTLYAVLHPNYIKTVFNFFVNSYCFWLLRFYILINIWALLVIFFNQTLDITYMLTFLHMFFLIIVGGLLYVYLYYRGRAGQIVTMIIVAFIMQAMIEWLSFMIPPFKEIINYTKSETTIAKGQGYSGVRANGLSGSDFFGLSAAFALVYVIFLSKRNYVFHDNRIIQFFLFVFLISGTFFAGRTGFVGVVIAIVIYLFGGKKRSFSKKEKLWFLIGVIAVLYGIAYIVFLYYTNEDIYHLMNYSFEAFMNFSSEGSFTTSSTEKLENHYYTIDFFTFLFGDGQYTLEDGSYYGRTDVGYMRVILYMGVIGLIMQSFMQIHLLNFKNGKELRLKKYLFVLLLILHAKGEVLVWNQIVLTTLTMYCLQDIFNLEVKNTSKITYSKPI